MDANSVNQILKQPRFMTVKKKDRNCEAEKEASFSGLFPESGLSVVGIKDTLQALINRQVEELVISNSFYPPYAECLNILESLLPGSEIPDEFNHPRLRRLLMADALVKYALRSGAKVTFIENGSLLKKVDGIGALLRRSH